MLRIHATLQQPCYFAFLLICGHAVTHFLNSTPSALHSSLFAPIMIHHLGLSSVPSPFRILVASIPFRFPGHGRFALSAWPSIPSRCIMALRRDPTMIVTGKYVRMHIIFDHVVPGTVTCIIQEIEAITQTQAARIAP